LPSAYLANVWVNRKTSPTSQRFSLQMQPVGLLVKPM